MYELTNSFFEMVQVKLDMNDPSNPIAKVKRVEIACTIQYAGDNAWNQDQLVPKLELDLYNLGWSLRGYHMERAWDKDMNIITEDEMNNYIYKIHGHPGSKCPSCPNPIKWKELEKLQMKMYMEQKEVLDDPHQGRQHGYNWATGENMKSKKEIVYILETQEERDERLKAENEADSKPKKKKNGTNK